MPWTRLTNQPFSGTEYPTSMCSHNGALLAGGYPGVRSMNADGTWATQSGLPPSPPAGACSELGYGYAGIGNNPGYLYKENGGSWAKVPGVQWNRQHRGITQAPDGTIYVSGGYIGSVFKIAPDGQVSTCATPALFQCWALVSDSSGNLYWGGETNQVFKSSDGAKTWAQIGPGGVHGVTALCALPDGSILAGKHSPTGAPLQRYDGLIWRNASTGLPGWSDAYALALRANGELWCGMYKHGAWRSADLGNTWVKRCEGLPVDRYFVRTMCEVNGTLYLSGRDSATPTAHPSGVWRLDP